MASLLTEVRKKENDAAIELLERVADGKFAIEEPVTESEESIGAPSPRITGRARTHTRADQDGL